MEQQNRYPPLISVVMPCYNAEKWVGQAIESILGQSVRDFELLVADDGSRDSTRELLRAWASRDSRIQVFERETNLGVARNLNLLLEAASGRYIARQDADDRSSPDRFLRQVSAFLKDPLLLMVSTRALVVGKGKLPRPSRFTPNDELQIGGRLCSANCFIHGSAMFRRDAGFSYDVSLDGSEDYDLWCRMFHAGKMACLPDLLYRLFRHAESVSNREHTKQDQSHDAVREAFRQTLLAKERCDILFTGFSCHVRGRIDHGLEAMVRRGLAEGNPLPAACSSVFARQCRLSWQYVWQQRAWLRPLVGPWAFRMGMLSAFWRNTGRKWPKDGGAS